MRGKIKVLWRGYGDVQLFGNEGGLTVACRFCVKPYKKLTIT